MKTKCHSHTRKIKNSQGETRLIGKAGRYTFAFISLYCFAFWKMYIMTSLSLLGPSLLHPAFLYSGLSFIYTVTREGKYVSFLDNIQSSSYPESFEMVYISVMKQYSLEIYLKNSQVYDSSFWGFLYF